VVSEYNKKVDELPPDPQNPTKLDEERLHELLEGDSSLWDLDRYGCNEPWAKDPQTKRALSELAELDRSEEELVLTSEETRRYINWNCAELNKVVVALSAMPSGSVTARCCLERGKLSADALKKIKVLNYTISLLQIQWPEVVEFKDLKSSSNIVPLTTAEASLRAQAKYQEWIAFLSQVSIGSEWLDAIGPLVSIGEGGFGEHEAEAEELAGALSQDQNYR
jgi:hypothetical protein